jgi:uncharacterized protein
MKIYLVFFLFLALSISAQEFPDLTRYANDFTRTLDQDQLDYLDNGLRTFDDSTSNQVVFLMIKSLDGYPIEMYTYETAQKNNIGTKGNDNGVLFFVAKNDRKMRIEVGYGLEGALPDALASSIIRNEVAPYFRKEQYYQGTLAGLNSILAATRGEYKGNPKTDDENEFPIGLIFFIIFMIFTLFGRRGRGGRGGGFVYFPGSLGGFGGRSGRSGMGGFGGFSGGGGSFGGGGASGSW